MSTRLAIGRLGEVLVEQQLLERGWHPVRLDTAQMASNADLVAIKRQSRVSIQVKTTDAKLRPHSHSDHFFFGHAKGYLLDKKPFFNSKTSPIIADIVVSVRYGDPPLFVVMPVAFAEKLCRHACDSWFRVPKGDGTKRSPNFPIYLRYPADPPPTMPDRDQRIRQNLCAYQDRWDLLSEPIEHLHDETAWSVT